MGPTEELGLSDETAVSLSILRALKRPSVQLCVLYRGTHGVGSANEHLTGQGLEGPRFPYAH